MKIKNKKEFEVLNGVYDLGFVDWRGRIVIDLRDEIVKRGIIELGQFSGEFVNIKTKSGYGLMDRNGKFIVEPKFNDVMGSGEM
jgi:hypothetical protein